MRAKIGMKLTCLFFSGVLLLQPVGVRAAYTVTEFQKAPAFVTNSVQPLTMLILDSSMSMRSCATASTSSTSCTSSTVRQTYDATKDYYGLFENDKYYYHPLSVTITGTCNYTAVTQNCEIPADTGNCVYDRNVCTYSSATVWSCEGNSSRGYGTYTNDTCDNQCDRLSDCKIAYRCTKNNKLYVRSSCGNSSNSCKNDSSTCIAETLTVTASTSNVDCSDNTDTTCTDVYNGVCVAKVPASRGSLPTDSYPGCTATRCGDYNNGVCIQDSPTNDPTLNQADCEALGGTYSSSSTPATQSCDDTSEIAACTALGGTCTTNPPVFGSRAQYWRKTPGVTATGSCGTSRSDPNIIASSSPGDFCSETGASVTLGRVLNHRQMTRLDLAKKVLTGGKTKGSPIPGTIMLDGDYSSTGNNGDILLEPDDPAPRGILQKFDALSWGLEVFNSSSGGKVVAPIGTPNADLIRLTNAVVADASTPMAESLNTAVRYFQQISQEYGGTTEYKLRNPVTLANNEWDPYFNVAENSYAPCGRASALLITDGEPYQDGSISDINVKTAAGAIEGNIATAPTYDDHTTPYPAFYLDDVAYWAHTHDLRPTSNMDGIQTMDLYVVNAFGGVVNADSLVAMKGAAKLGGFIDKDQNGEPNPAITGGVCGVGNTCEVYADASGNFVKATGDKVEWDKNGDGVPDNYALAEDGDQLAQKLEDMLGQILQKMSAGSAASVISASRSGEGAIYQAIFYPKTPPDSGFRNITWPGDVHAMWLDDYGNMRADCDAGDTGDACTVSDGILSPRVDKIVELYTDPTTGESMIKMFRDPEGDNKYDSTTDFISEGSFRTFNHFLWSGAQWLALASTNQKAYTDTNKSAGRYIFTQKGGVAVPFTTADMASNFPGTLYYQYLNASDTTEADKIVNYIRGQDFTGYRSRLYDWGNGDGPQVHKLGDIVGSTPTVVSKPAEDYDLLYRDQSYRRFKNTYANRRIMIYAGGNDGGLHAFNGGYYDRANRQFLDGPSTKIQYELGSEMWMFIPQNALPHLKWLTDPDYPHVYYADLKPYIFDAKIFTPSATHPDGWGTLLVGGMGFGGGPMTVGGNTFRSSYFILDITDPEVPPTVLAEFTDPNLGFTTGSPTAIPMLDCDRFGVSGTPCPDNLSSGSTWPMTWYLAFGSGPYDPTATQSALLGKSIQDAQLYVLDLSGGSPSKVGTYTIPAGFPDSFFSDLIAVDFDLDFRTDSLYFGSIANTESVGPDYTGGVHRLAINVPTGIWTLNTLFDAGRPVSAAPAAAYDGHKAWIYFGTGRLMSADDKSDYSQQSYFGLKETYDTTSGLMDLTQQSGGNLVNVSDIRVLQGGNLYDSLGPATLKAWTGNAHIGYTSTGSLLAKTFQEFDVEIGEDTYDGWRLDFPDPNKKERNLGQASILGKVLAFTTYMPSNDICTAEGESYLWAPYYRTGTAYYKPIVGTTVVGGETENLRKISIGRGMTTSPSIHVGGESGSKSFIQTSTGAIIGVDLDNPGITKSGLTSWRDLGTDE